VTCRPYEINQAVSLYIYLGAFLFLVLCPAIHQLDCAANHEIIIKNGTRTQQREFQENADSSPTLVLNAFPAAFHNPSIPADNNAVILLPVTSFNLSVLSTVRLNL
jgi:hypothetical protein